ncbi:MAG: SpoIIE family protein phosphatase [Steroidobacteraceae bacterium]
MSDTRAIRVLLVDDQRMIGEAVRRLVVDEPGLVFEYCQKPEEAMAKAESFRPTVILQDLVMPGVEGLSLVDAYRAHPELRHVPTIVLSSKEEPVVKAEAFARGANDYLVKLPDRIELLARIRYHSTGYNLLLERNAAFAALAESQRALAAELAEAAEYVRSRLPAAQEGSIGVRWDFESSTSLGGDAFGYHWVDDEHFAAYVLDVCGHGVGAALLSVSAMNTLSARALRNIDFREPDQVLAGLNEVFPMEQHNNMYFTIWYGVFRPADRKLKFATAGHPPALLFPPGTRQPGRLIANALPIGAMEGVEYPVGEAEVPAGSRLYLFSDGVYEVRKTDGNEMVLDDFIDLVADPQPAGPAGIGGVRKAVASLQGRDTFDDDFSLMELTFA